MSLNNKFFSDFFIKITICTACCNAAKIFCIFPAASYSHQQPLLALSYALAARGHDLTVITTDPSKVPIKNHREIDISHLYEIFGSNKLVKNTGFSMQKRSDGFEYFKSIPYIMDYALSLILEYPEIQNLIKEMNGTKFDLIIHEVLAASGLLGFADLIGNPPIIGVSTVQLMGYVGATLGNPVIPSYMPPLFFGISDHMTFWERFLTLYFEMYVKFIMDWYTKPMLEKRMHENFHNYHRSLYDLENNQSLLIVSSDLATGYPKPLHSNTIHVGPMHLQRKLDPLPEDIQKWMDEAEDGVIYFSLGSNMKGTSVPEYIRAAFIKAFKQFPKVRVLWKWEADTRLPGQPKNVLVKKWLPQQAILAHPKTRVFISQVGLQSYQEAIYYSVPILAVPLYLDQDFNAKKLVSSGSGLSVEFQAITYDIINEKLELLLTNKSFKENMFCQSSIMRDTPMPQVDTAVWWVEYVIRHNGAPHLRPASLDLTWYQYYMLDILLLILLSVTITFNIFYFIAKKLIKLFSSLISKSSDKSNKKKTN